MKRLQWLWVAWAVVGCGGRQAAATAPRTNAIELLEVGITETRPEIIRPMIGDVYRQHNPRVPDGPEGLMDFVTAFAEVPAENRVHIETMCSASRTVASSSIGMLACWSVV